MRRHIRRNRHRFFKRAIWRTRLIFWGGAILVGLVAAVFAKMAESADLFFHSVIQINPYLPLVITPLGLVLTAYITRHFFNGAEGSGIPQTLAVLSGAGAAIGNRYLTLKIAIGKLFLCVLGLLFGASVGRVGPTVHIGAAIMVSLGRYTFIKETYLLRGLIMAGGGAGIAAAFNTPLAGIMFVIEEMGRSFDRRNISMIMVAIILAGLTAIVVHHSNYDYSIVTTPGHDYLLLAVAVVVCGIVGGLLGGGFSQVLITASNRLAPYMKSYWVAITFVCGIVIAVTGIISGGSAFGSGYIETREIVSCAGNAQCLQQPGVLYPVYKMITTIATYLSGIPAGIFVPSLATGAGLGRDIAMFFPVELASTIVVIAMVAYFSGVVQTPITAFIIVMEMTHNQDLVLALMATSLLASGTSKLICKKPIYTALAENFLAMIADKRVHVEANKDSA